MGLKLSSSLADHFSDICFKNCCALFTTRPFSFNLSHTVFRSRFIAPLKIYEIIK